MQSLKRTAETGAVESETEQTAKRKAVQEADGTEAGDGAKAAKETE